MRSIEVLPKAQRDIRRNAAWLRQTFSWNGDIVAAIHALMRHPDQHPEADEAADLGMPLRCKLHGRRPHVFRILFMVTDAAILVLRVLHAAQDRVIEDDL